MSWNREELIKIADKLLLAINNKSSDIDSLFYDYQTILSVLEIYDKKLYKEYMSICRVFLWSKKIPDIKSFGERKLVIY